VFLDVFFDVLGEIFRFFLVIFELKKEIFAVTGDYFEGGGDFFFCPIILVLKKNATSSLLICTLSVKLPIFN